MMTSAGCLVATGSKQFDRRRAVVRFALPAFLSIAPAVFSVAPAFAETPLECPDSFERAKYYVTAANFPSVKVAGAEAVVLTGLAQWLEDRAQAEFRLWVVDDTFGRICGKPPEPERSASNEKPDDDNDKSSPLRTYFPSACDLHDRLDTADPLQLGTSYEVLVTAARDDLEYVPACAIYQVGKRRLPIGYQLQSVYEQYAQGEDLDRLFYGLYKHELINTPRKDAPPEERLCQRRSDGTFTSYCGLIIPLLAYATALESSDGGDFLTKLQDKFHDKRFDLREIDWEYDPEEARAALARFKDHVRRVEALLKEIEESGDAPREEIVLKLLQLGEMLADEFEFAFSIAQIDNPDLRRNVYVLSELLRAYSAIRAREYVNAVTRVARIVNAGGALYNCKPPALTGAGPPDPYATAEATEACTESLSGVRDLTSGSLLLASLAEAKTSGEFAARLDEIASPVGAYRLKRLNSMWTLNGFPGVSYGEQELTVPVPGQPSTTISSDTGALFAPVGISRSWATPSSKGSFGLFFSLIDVGNLVDDSEGEIRVGNATITTDVEPSLANAFAPGLFATWSPRPFGPITVGIGTSFGTAGNKTVRFADGSEVEAEREWGVRAFFAMDVVVVPFRRR